MSRERRAGRLPREATNSIELIRAQYRKSFWQILVGWRNAASTAKQDTFLVSAQQQFELAELVVTMAIQLGEAEGRARLTATLSANEFERDMEHLLESTAMQAEELWTSGMTRYRLEALVGTSATWNIDIRRRVLAHLRPFADGLILRAWAHQEKRLELELNVLQTSNPETDSSFRTSGAAVSGPLESTGSLAEKVNNLRRDKGLSMDGLAEAAHLDKKTVLGILNKGTRPHPDTLKKIADVLGVAARDLQSD